MTEPLENVELIDQEDLGPRHLWDLLSAVLPIFVNTLPLAKNVNDAIRVRRAIPKIRAQFELIGLSLESPSFEEQLQNDSFSCLLEGVDKVLAGMETFISGDILEFSPSETKYYSTSEYVKLSLLGALHVQQSSKASSFINFKVSSTKATVFFQLLDALNELNEAITEALESVFADVGVDTRMSDADFAAIHRAANFSVASTAIYNLLAEQITALCDAEAHNGALHLCGFTNQEVSLLFPLCKEAGKWYPVTATIQSPHTGSQPHTGNRKHSLESICSFVKDSKRRRKTAQVIYSKQCALEKADVSSFAPHSQVPQLRVALCELIDPDHSDACPLHIKGKDKGKHVMSPADRKRLTVILARSLLYLYGSPWIQHFFSLEKLFLCATDLASLRGQHPYLYFSIPLPCDVDDESYFQEDIWKHPHVVAFGLRLLEIESGGIITPEEEDRDPEFDDRVAPYYTLERALRSLKGDGRVEDAYLKVAQSCLDFDDKLSSVHQPQLSPDKNYRLAIYKFIVSPLLEQLIIRFSEHAFDLLETSKGVEEAPSRGTSPLPRADKKNYNHGWSGGANGAQRPQDSVRYAEAHAVRHQTMDGADMADRVPMQMMTPCTPAVSCPTVKLTPSAISPQAALFPHTFGVTRLFDEIMEMTGESKRWAQRSEKFFSLFESFRKEHMKPVSKRVKIAVLDTGIDEDQLGIDRRREAIKEKRQETNPAVDGDPIKALRSFVGPSVLDTCGHGTHIAEILMRLAPEADFYIAKISDGLEVETVDQIAEAIDWALAPPQDVDIVSMSFGLRPAHVPESSFSKVEGAIHRAATGRKLMFAAASNCGGNASRTYPATDERVICVNACDGLGFDAVGFNPPQSSYSDCLSTLGVGIKCFWGEEYVYKSGTSFATPVAAAIAANVLDFASYSVEKGMMAEQRLRDLRQSQGMRKAFQRFLSEEIQEHRFVAPWQFWKDGATDEYIWQKLKVEYD